MGADESTSFLTHLAFSEKVSASTQNQARFALLFLCSDVPKIDLPRIENVVRAKWLPFALERKYPNIPVRY